MADQASYTHTRVYEKSTNLELSISSKFARIRKRAALLLLMTTIKLSTLIKAPAAICFDLSLSIDLEVEATRAYKIRAVSGITSGKIGAGQRVGWKSKQFGLTVSHLSEITRIESPSFFQDTMIIGIFKSFQHDHFFRSLRNGETEMSDVLRFAMPPWLLGPVAEHLVVRRRLVHLIKLRNTLIKRSAELAAS